MLSTNIFMTVPRINSSSVELFNGHGYAVFKGKFTWCEAEMLCELMGGHLATVNDFDEQQFLCSINGNRDSLWLGGYRYYFDPDSWRWVTGEPWDFTNWGDDEPNGGNNPGDECCCVLWPVLWNDLSDSNLHEQSGFICEWEPGGLPE